MKYIIDRNYYSYFGGSDKHEYKYFDTLLDAWQAYKRDKANDFNYGDAWQFTSFRVVRNYAVAKQQRPHARTESEWLKLKAFMLEYECKGMSAAYVAANAYDIMLAHQATPNPFYDDPNF